MMTKISRNSAIKGKAMTKDTKISGRTASFLKLKLLASGSLTAGTILLALTPQTALAQAAPSPSGHAVNGNPTFTLGDGEFSPDATVDTVFVNSDQVILDWALSDESGTGTVNFLPNDNGLIFDRSNGGDYTVLNRIMPTDQTRSIGIDGNVSSFSAGSTAGNIWFYSPGGIIAGAGSNFNVGSLLLTTNAIDITGGLFGADGEIRFNGPAGSTSGITIANGAQINALADNSYVAMVAPRIVQGGTVTVNGSVGYVAAEQADITINNGLFDINVTVGSESSSGIEHTGTTTGPPRVAPVESPDSDNHKIYMVTVPKNQAMTMLLSGSIGYMPATGAIVNSLNGSIVLSAGGSIASNGFNNMIDETIDPSRNASINISNANIISDIEAFANNDIILDASDGASITAARDSLSTTTLDFSAGNAVRMEASNGGTIDLDGGATFNTINGAQIIVGEGSSINIGEELTVNAFSETQGGVIDILISGSGSRVSGSGELIVGHELNVNAGIIGLSGSDTSLEQGLDTFGGTINLDITAGGLLDINANGVGLNSIFDVSAAPIMGTVTAGEATGGTINVNIDGTGGTLTNNGTSTLIFDARGLRVGDTFGSSTGGTNSGGTINFNVTGGLINAYSINALASASGTGNGSIDGAPNTGVSENGSNAGDITAYFTDATLNIENRLLFETTASEQSRFDSDGNKISGKVTGGNLNVTFDNTELNASSLELRGNISGDGPAGDLFLNVINGSNLSLTNYLQLAVEGHSGLAGTATNSGNVNLLVDNASLDTPSYTLSSARVTTALAGAPTDGATGSVNVMVQNGGSLTGSNFYANAFAATETQGGTATAGDINITIDGGTMALNDGSFVILSAGGYGFGNADDSSATERGLGVGGNITVTLDNGGSFSADSFSSDTSGRIFDNAEGPIPIRGQGGSGIGGTSTFNLNDGSFTVSEMSVSSNGSGSFGGNSGPFGFPEQPGVVGDGGNGQGGDVIFNLGGADVVAGSLLISAIGIGGDGGNGSDLDGAAAGNAGTGTGGNITFNATAGSLSVSDGLTMNSNGVGGRGGDGIAVNAGGGGDAVGGNVSFSVDGTATLAAPLVTLSAIATGGRGGDATPDGQTGQPAQRAGDGGNAVGGSALFSNFGINNSLSFVEVTATGTGGDAGNDPDAPERFPDPFSSPLPPVGYVGQIAGNGGSGTGGIATVNLGQDDNNNVSYQINADGFGAKGGGGISGGLAGNGTGGAALLGITNASVSLGDLLITATGTGGNGGIANDILGDGGNGGDGIGGSARLDLSGPNTELTVNSESLPILSDGFGGAGADGSSNSGGDGGQGGNGGSASGGISQIAVRTGANIIFGSEAFTLSSTGFGGQGGQGGGTFSNTSGNGGNGGQGTGGTARLLAQGGTITGNDVTIITVGQGGSAGEAGAVELVDEGISGVRGVGGSGAGGTAILEVQEGSPGIITLGNVYMIANGFNGADDIIPTGLGGRIEITDTSTDPAGLISLASLNAEALAGAGSASGFFMSGNSGTTDVAGDFTVNVAGDVVFTFDGDGQLDVGGAIDIDTPQNFIVTHTNRATDHDSIISAGDFNVTVGGNIDASADSGLRSGANIDFRADGNIGFTNLNADGSMALLSGGDITGDMAAGALGINIVTPGIVTIGSLDSNGTVEVTGTQGIELQTLIGDNALLIATDGDIAVRDNAALTNGVTARGHNILLRSTGNMEVVAEATDGNIDIASTGNLLTYGLSATGDILFSSTGGSVTIEEVPAQAGGDLTVTAATDAIIVTGALAGNNLSITAGDLIALQALASGTTINLSSADLNIGTPGQLGTFSQTNAVYIESNGTNQAILGGTGTSGVFSLSEEEFGRIQTNQNLTIYVQATGADTPDLVIQDLTIESASDPSAGQMTEGTLGFGGALTIDSGQSIRMDGDLNLTNAADSTYLYMTALDDIRINANGGVIQITDANGDFGTVGTLSMSAQNIYAMTDQAFDDINGLSLSDIDLRLGDSDGIDLDGGLIRAGFAQLFVSENLFIQNSAPDGGFDSRRGFSVGSLVAGSSSGNNINIVINGVIDGVTGADTIELTTIEGQFDPASTINGCLITDPTSCGAPPPPPTTEIPVIDPVQDIIEEEVDSGESGSSINGPLQNNLIEIKEVDEFINDPLINAPVTGAGNDDLWGGANGAGNGDNDSDCEEGSTECE